MLRFDGWAKQRMMTLTDSGWICTPLHNLPCNMAALKLENGSTSDVAALLRSRSASGSRCSSRSSSLPVATGIWLGASPQTSFSPSPSSFVDLE
jgi:hypothetical protein